MTGATALTEQSLAAALEYFKERRVSMPLGLPTGHDLLQIRRMEAGLPANVAEAYLFVDTQNVRFVRRIQTHQKRKESYAAGRKLARHIRGLA